MPMNAEIIALPGTDQTGIITVNLPAGPADDQSPAKPMRLRVQTSDWTLGHTGIPQFFKAKARPDSCTGWTQVNPSEVDVPPGQSCQVRYTLHVPVEAQGSYHTVLLFQSAPEPMAGRHSGMQIRGQIACVLYVQVGPQVRRVRVTAFAVTPSKVTLTLRNTGNSQVRPKGICRFTDSTGAVVGQVPVTGIVILPGDDGLRDLSLDTPTLKSGDYVATVMLDYGGDALVGARTHVHIP